MFSINKVLQEFFLLPLFLIIAASCEYDPGNEYFREVMQKEPVPLVVKFNQNDSLIYLWKPTEFTYEITSALGEIKRCEVYLNNEPIGNIYSNTGTFSINPNNLSDGTYPLRLDFIIGYGTGSLADRLDAEVYSFRKNFVLTVDRASAPCSITQLGIDQGRLRIDWELYPKDNFEKYILDDFNQLLAPFEFTNINQTFFYDDRFMGGKGYYTFRVESGGNISDIQQYSIEFPYPKPQEFKTENDNSLTIKWNKYLFYSNFSKYLITSKDYQGNEITYVSIDDVNDTTASINDFPFGKSISYYLTTRSNIEDVEVVTSGEAYLGDPSFHFISGMAYCPYPHHEIYYYYDELFRHSPENQQDTKMLGSNWYLCRFTEDEKYLLSLDMSTSKLTLFTIPGQDVEATLFFNHLPIDYAISETGKAVILSDSLYIYDFITQKKLQIALPNADYSNFRVYISADGKVIYFDDPNYNDKLYLVQDEQALIINFPAASFCGFNPLNDSEFLTFSNNTLNIYSNSTYSKVRSYQLSGPLFSNIDPASGYFMVRESDIIEDISTFGLYNILNGQKAGQLNATTKKQFEYSDRPLSYMIFNKIIYSPYGYKLKIID